MENWKTILSELADPGDYEVQGGLVLFGRLGRSHCLEIVQLPHAGVAVQTFDDQTYVDPIPISKFIQSQILDLGRFSKQISKALEARADHAVIPYIDVAARFTYSNNRTLEWTDNTAVRFRDLLLKTEPDVTRIIQLMAPAGQGKTALLENLALTFARDYFPDNFPKPLLLPVDLLGRYVGNVEDAIAGSLNNLFRFPLPQRDILQVMKRHWLILALDGFDELVARTSLREAFLRINELVDHLDGAGTIILSARETFFDLWQVTTAIRTYLQPKRGTYLMYSIELSQWQSTQAVRVFSHLGSPQPAADLEHLQEAFGRDSKILFNPFLLIRVAKLWMEGERFAKANQELDSLARMELVVGTFVHREATQKWKDREENIILPLEAHYEMLASIAEEMWMSNAMYLDNEELGIAAEIGLLKRNLAKESTEAVKARIATHAVFTSFNKQFRFLHDQFFYFFLGHRIARLLLEDRSSEVRSVLEKSELSSIVAEWISFFIGPKNSTRETVCKKLATLKQTPSGEYEPSNLALLLAQLLDRTATSEKIELGHLHFTGSALLNRQLTNIRFDGCKFLNVDISNSAFLQCEFLRCDFASILVDHTTLFTGSNLVDCSISRFEFPEGGGIYSPSEIYAFLVGAGAIITSSSNSNDGPYRNAAKDALRCLELFVKRSGRGSDVVVEEIAEYVPRFATQVAKLAIECNIAKEVARSASGSRKMFLRFVVDKNNLLEALSAPSRDDRIENFWSHFEKRFPR